jgi:hypothetical protein
MGRVAAAGAGADREEGMSIKDEMLNRQIAVLLHGADNIESRVCTRPLDGVGEYEVQSVYNEDALAIGLADGTMFRTNCYRQVFPSRDISAYGIAVGEMVVWKPCLNYATGPYDNVFSLVAEIEAAGYFVKITTPKQPGQGYDIQIAPQGWEGNDEYIFPSSKWCSKSLRRALCAGYVWWRSDPKVKVFNISWNQGIKNE